MSAPPMKRTACALAALVLALTGCGSGGDPALDFSCGELRDDARRYSAMAREIVEEIVPPSERNNPDDCDRECNRKFTRSVKLHLMRACVDADADHRPRERVVREIETS